MMILTKLSGNVIDHIVETILEAKRAKEEEFLKALEDKGLKIVRMVEIQNPLMSVSSRNVDVPVHINGVTGVRGFNYQHKVVYEDDQWYSHMLELRIPVVWRE